MRYRRLELTSGQLPNSGSDVPMRSCHLPALIATDRSSLIGHSGRDAGRIVAMEHFWITTRAALEKEIRRIRTLPTATRSTTRN